MLTSTSTPTWYTAYGSNQRGYMVKRKQQSKNRSVWFALLGLAVLGVVLFVLSRGHNVALLNSQGLVANEQRRLLILSTSIMLGLAIPTLGLLYFFAWKYRDTNPRAAHDPHARPHRAVPAFLWGIPLIVLAILVSIMLPATQRLEPSRQIDSDRELLKIQVVALRWKWLFIYPDQKIATVNYAQIPVDTPVQFELTADETPMSSFWIPNLAGQLYAMTEHVNRLNVMADTVGDYPGSVAEINGAGFSGMRFTTRVSSQQDFETWVVNVQGSPDQLSFEQYAELLQPSENNPEAFFRDPDPKLFGTILSKYVGSNDESAKHDHGGY
ncbi:cytochrome ubiquinol oxidase subunit II [Patescibacteria group bacterium]|nr:MAG: cytochrome ubiquinol oxidase subunit II [Patescibacteria group bacterium]